MKTTSIRKAIAKISNLLWLEKQDIMAVYLYSIFAGLVSLSLPLGIQTIIGFVQAGSISTSIVILIALVLLGTMGSGYLQVRQLELIEKVEQKMFLRYSIDYAERLPKLNIQKLDGYYLPELVNRFFDLPGLQKSLHKILVDLPTAIIQIFFGILLLSFYHPFFIAFGITLTLLLVWIISATSKKGFQTSIETSDYKYRIASWLEEMARGIKTFKYSQHSNLHINKTDKLLNGYFKARTGHFKVLQLQYWVLILFKTLIVAAMLIIGVNLLIEQQINIGQFIAADIVILTILTSVEKLIGSLEQIYDALTSVEKLDKVLKAEIEVSGTGLLYTGASSMDINFKQVSFAYNEKKELLKNVDFHIKPGEWALVKGSFGSGKSTLLRLITGSFKKDAGEIIINSNPIGSYEINSLREQMGILAGDQEIFDGTLMENLTLGQDNISMENLHKFIELTGLNEFIQKNDAGLYSNMMPFGMQLSSKTKMQVLLCRALLMAKSLLILEEPFVYIEKERLAEIFAFIRKMNITVIMTTNTEQFDNHFDQTIKL
jgi:ATP-binding cassette subfamily B protein